MGFDLDATNDVIRVRVNKPGGGKVDATYKINGRTPTDPIYVLGGSGSAVIENIALYTLPPFAWMPMDGYAPFGQM